ncbi:MAG TPA: FtsX-like permease family protein, partial [Terriglobales bacterium]|nr:FtsX-like permease family protein [Terriglobales bacterium]
FRVLGFTFAIAILTGLIFGLAPALRASRVDLTANLKAGGKGSLSGGLSVRHDKLRGALVVAELAISLPLLVGAGLLVRTLRNLENADLGMKVSGLVVFGTNPPQQPVTESSGGTPDTAHANFTPAATTLAALRFYNNLLDRLRTIPGVESATVMGNRLGSGWSNNTGVLVDGAVPGGKQFAIVRWNEVGPDYFHVLQTPLVLGRDLSDADTPSSPKVAIINQTFADRYLKGQNALGHHIQVFGKKSPEYTIVGVAANSRYTGIREDPRPMAYLPFTQVPTVGAMHLELRTSRSPNAVLDDARRVLHDFGADVPMLQPMTQREQFEETITNDRLFARLSMFFGILAGLLVATGLYGTLAYRVSRRTSEIGVRMAIGARPSQVLWMVLRESLLICAAGALVGLPAALACSRLLRTMLFGLSDSDPLSFALAVTGVVMIALIASAVPALRASAVEPVVALRCE